ncbi:MAG: DUF1801 domain-containing protein [Pseudomonadota bacterium]
MLLASVAAFPSPPPEVAAVFSHSPPAARGHLTQLRALILETAAAHPEIGPLTETLKWGEPSYLPKRSRTGTTIRLGWDEAGQDIRLFVHCQTTLIQEWRDRYAPELTFVGNRELRLPTDTPLPIAALKHCVAMALTYHLRKRTP